MKARLLMAWHARLPLERVMLTALALLLGASLYVWFVHSLGQARVQLRTSVTALRAQAALLDLQAIEVGHLRTAPAATASTTDLRTLVQARAGDAGLASALVRIDALDADQIVVTFGAVVFADWLNWLAGMEAQYVRLDTCRIEALSTPGMVSVTATLVRTRPQ